MVYISVITFLWLGVVFYLYSQKLLSTNPTRFKNDIIHSLQNPGKKESFLLLFGFFLFLLLPLLWGLGLFLRTDANVIVVIGFIIWVYNWIKFLLPARTSE